MFRTLMRDYSISSPVIGHQLGLCNLQVLYFNKSSGGKSSIQLGWDYQGPEEVIEEKKIRTPLQMKYMTEMGSNAVYSCFNDGQGMNRDYRGQQQQQHQPPMNQQHQSKFNKDIYAKSMKYAQSPPQVMQSQNINTNKGNSNQLEDYYPYHLTYCSDNYTLSSSTSNNQFQAFTSQKPINTITSTNGNGSRKSYEQFLNDHLLAKETMNNGTSSYELTVPQHEVPNQQVFNHNNVYNNNSQRDMQYKPNYNQTAQLNYHNTQIANNKEGGDSNSNETKPESSWNSCFNRRKPPTNKYEFIY